MQLGNRHFGTIWNNADTGTHLFSRGFTGHSLSLISKGKHLNKFDIINMNGRLYDPLLGRFLSPDPVIQDISNPQNFNRYRYCLNNPFRYFDPSGFEYDDYEDTYWGDDRADIDDGPWKYLNVGFNQYLVTDNKEVYEFGILLPEFEIAEHRNLGPVGWFEMDNYEYFDRYDPTTDDREFDDRSQDMDDYKNSEQPAGSFGYGNLSESFNDRSSRAEHQLPSQDFSSPENGALADMLKAIIDFMSGKDDSDKKVNTDPTTNSSDDWIIRA